VAAIPPDWAAEITGILSIWRGKEPSVDLDQQPLLDHLKRFPSGSRYCNIFPLAARPLEVTRNILPQSSSDINQFLLRRSKSLPHLNQYFYFDC
jgi:hypothetical protein